MARMRIALQRLLHDQRQPIEALAHVGVACRQPHPNARGDRDHRRVNVLTTRASAVASTSTPTMIRSPLESTISIRPIGSGAAIEEALGASASATLNGTSF